MVNNTGGNSLTCGWCGKYLGNASKVTILNGNQPVCDLCLLRNSRTENAYDQWPKKDLRERGE